ncbi:hypothetical protein NCCP2716_13810 [Sporosarcina sp. NCCP-2716]|uniref:DUF2628 domain-containing protein n=1 Tax=Sporosarcina sp. NCCP-2716 TaxID=2943679 RepID=UPI00203CF60C|nr:DUF2628 domain-containing protein [Sporosarcina sp. NCCP-2716]GKV68883.1 hypothetical protein NCCP2716_13810 [Sporosarcina sp. NCCP-2716]
MTANRNEIKPDTSSEALRLLVGPNDQYYLTRWSRRDKFTFNWPAFLFIFLWRGYRKMYGLVAGVLAVCLLIDFFGAVFHYDVDLVVNVLVIVFAIFLGFNGTALYRWSVTRRLRKLEARTAPEDLLEAADRRRANWIGVVLVWIALLVYMGLSMQIGRLLEHENWLFRH